MKDNSFIFFDESFTSYSTVTPTSSNLSEIKTTKVVYRVQFAPGIDYDYDVHGPIYKCMSDLFTKICEANGISIYLSAFNVGPVRRKKTKDAYMFNLNVFDFKLNKIIQDSIIIQAAIGGGNSPIGTYLTKYLEGKPFDIKPESVTTDLELQNNDPIITIPVLHIFNTVEKDLNKILRGFGKLYMDSEFLRTSKNKFACNDYIIDKSTANYITINRSVASHHSEFEHGVGYGVGIEVTLPIGIETGFVIYLKRLTEDNTLATTIDNAINKLYSVSIRKEQ